jgi:hypothetical protein
MMCWGEKPSLLLNTWAGLICVWWFSDGGVGLGGDGVLGVDVAGVVVLALVDWGSSRVCFTTVRFLYLVLMPWVYDTWWHALGDYAAVVSCPSRQGLGYFHPAPLVIRPSPWWLSTVVLFLNDTCQLLPWLFLYSFDLLADIKIRRKKRKKEERRFLASLELYL